MTKLTEIEKLRIAAYAAPRVRDDNGRPIKVIDKDGVVVRETNSRELAETMHARAGIEFEVHLDAKPLVRSCSKCGRPFLMPKHRTGGQPPKRCHGCRTVHKPESERKKRVPREPPTQTVCAGFNGPCPDQSKPGHGAFDPNRVKLRSGEPWRCRVCGGRKQASRAGDRFSRAGRAGWANKTTEQRSDHSRKIHEAQTPEQRSARQRKAAETAKRRQTGTP